MSGIDKRGKLEKQPFTYRTTKDGKVFIHWHDRQIMILKGESAEKFITAIEQADTQQAQLLMARVTGHFKHGNES
jgi:putative SOS response-associated peptidase YedK